MDTLKTDIDIMSTKMSSYDDKLRNLQTKVGNLEWTITYLKDVIRSLNIDTLLPRELGEVLVELIRNSTDNEVFRMSDEYDFDSTINKLANTKTLLNWGQYLELCILLEDVDNRAEGMDKWADEDKLNNIFQKLNGMSYKEFMVAKWFEAIQKLISYIESLTNKGDIPQNVMEQKSCVTTLSPSNLIQEAIKFHKSNNSTSNDLSETIQEMLGSKRFILCETFLSKKMNFIETNAHFLSAIAPHTLEKKDIMAVLFI